MKHRVFGRKFKRDTKERKALFRGLISSLVLKGKIKTTEAKAKAIKGQADKVVSWAKKGTLVAKRQLSGVLSQEALKKLFDEVSPQFANRSSGFTQMIKIGPRKGDGALMVLLQWVGLENFPKKEPKKKTVAKEEKTRKLVPVKEAKKSAKRKVASKKK